jgi:glutathione S-transferase
MTPVCLFGARYSVYTRIAELVLLEAEVPYALEEIDIFRPDTVPASYAARHPFGKVPALEHAGLRFYETDAIATYATGLTAAGRALIAQTPSDEARMRQIMRVLDNYAYPACVWGVYVPEHEGAAPDGVDTVAAARAGRVLDALGELATAPYLQGATPTLADLWALPMLAYLVTVPTGRRLVADRPWLQNWLERMNGRPAVQQTRFAAEMARADSVDVGPQALTTCSSASWR